MGTHNVHTMQGTSLKAYREDIGKLNKRAQRILGVFKEAARAMSARDILDHLNAADGTDIQDMNYVRPRITELGKAGLIFKTSERMADRISGKTVATFQYASVEKQLGLNIC